MFAGLEAPSHWLIVALVVVVLLGYQKLPDAARSIGRSLRIFKTELKGLSEDDQRRTEAMAAPADEPAVPSTDVPVKPN